MNQKLIQKCRGAIGKDQDVSHFVSDRVSRLRRGEEIEIAYSLIPIYEFAIKVMKELRDNNKDYEHKINGLNNTYIIRRLI